LEERRVYMWDRISEAWCKSMHSKAMWPMHGKYTCPDCFREFPVEWAEMPTGPEAAEPPNQSYLWSKPPAGQMMGRLKRSGTM